MPNCRICKTIRELFNHKDPKTKEHKRGLLCDAFEYTTYNDKIKVLRHKKLMPGLFDEILNEK